MKEKILTFFSDVKKEMAKVSWPEKNELKESTIVVLVVCLILTVFVYVVDWLVAQGVKGIF